jgi:O-antigen chain-terminating methyltransferase
MRDEGIGAYGVDIDARLVDLCREKGLEVYRVDAETHLRQLREATIDGAFAAHFAEHVEPGALIEILRQFRRVLQPGAPLVFATPNARTLTVSAHTFWTDPSHRRPIPPELFEFLLLVEGFVDVRTDTYAPSEERKLNEDVADPIIRENLRYLNERLFGDRDYAVIGHQPT